MLKNSILLVVSLLFIGCTASNINTTNELDNRNKITLGTIQKDIKIGVSKTHVLTHIGSPNLVTNNGNQETWVYDKISSTVSQDNSSVNGAIIGTGAVLGFISGSKETNNKTTSQSSLTLILIFDENNKLISQKYHMSKF